MQYGYFCRVWTRPDGWRRRPSQWPAHNVHHHQHVDLWWIYPSQTGSRSQQTSTNSSVESFNFYSSSRMFLSCNLLYVCALLFSNLQIVIPGYLYHLPNKLEWIDSLSFHWVLTWENPIFNIVVFNLNKPFRSTIKITSFQ